MGEIKISVSNQSIPILPMFILSTGHAQHFNFQIILIINI